MALKIACLPPEVAITSGRSYLAPQDQHKVNQRLLVIPGHRQSTCTCLTGTHRQVSCVLTILWVSKSARRAKINDIGAGRA